MPKKKKSTTSNSKLFDTNKKATSYQPKWGETGGKDHLWRLKNALKGK